METEPSSLPELEYRPVTPERWKDLEVLFGERGAYSGCWCMWWRLTRAAFHKQSGQERKRAMKAIVDSGQVPGILAYANGQPIGWCSVGPRETYPVLDRSRTLKRVDDRPVWSIVCFFVAEPFRGHGLMAKLLQAAIDYAKESGASVVEGYPIEPKGELTGCEGFTGLVSAFLKTGFVEVLRRSERQPIMRYFIR
ncbi:MAG: GNAT family N-acetyltransferase [Thermoplasmata archaeon]